MEVEVPRAAASSINLASSGNDQGNKQTNGKKKKTLIISAATLLLVAGGGLVYKTFSGSTDKPSAVAERSVLTVQLVPVKQVAFERKLLVSGTVAAWDPVSVGSEASGLKVESIAVDEGTRVKKGQIMALLNGQILRAQLAQQQARLSSAKASLTKAIQPNRPEDIAALRAAYAQARANVAQEEANLIRAAATSQEAAANAKRYESLVKAGVVSIQEGMNRSTSATTSQADVQSGEQKVAVAKFAADQAHEKLVMAEAGGRNEDVMMSRSSLAEIEASVKQLTSEVDQTVIKAPCDGLVVKRSVHIGDIAASSKVMFELVRDSRLEFRAQVPETDISRIHPGQLVQVQAVMSTSPAVQARVREISPTIDLDSRLGTVKIDLPDLASATGNHNDPAATVNSTHFRSGNFAKGEIFLGKENVTAVPASSLVYKDNRALVFTVSKDNLAQMHFVEAGERDLDNIEIKSGLANVSSVVAKGAGFLKDGDKVKVVEN